MEECINTMSIMTEEQECYLNFLYKYQRYLYKFFNYNNVPQWLKEEKKIDKTIISVMTGEYLNSADMCDYINVCNICVEEMERGEK